MAYWRNTIDKILGRITKTENCWIWNGHLVSGYAYVRFKDKSRRVHRVVYEALKGPIPDGLVLDHLCRNPACVNPDHLEPVTQQTNVLRGNGIPVQNAQKTHCKYGHPLFGPNLWYNVKAGERQCRTCMRERTRQWKLKHKAVLQ